MNTLKQSKKNDGLILKAALFDRITDKRIINTPIIRNIVSGSFKNKTPNRPLLFIWSAKPFSHFSVKTRATDITSTANSCDNSNKIFFFIILLYHRKTKPSTSNARSTIM